jgi:Rrf2 family iron-sulfur cluster assembly transcriptional regulator
MLAMLYLAWRGPAEPARAVDIARAHGLSKGYLEGLLAALRRAGLVRALRGPGGGWVLARPAARIRPLEVYRALEGPTALVPCAEDQRLCSFKRPRCRARRLWVRMGRSLERELRSENLARLAGVARAKRKKAASRAGARSRPRAGVRDVKDPRDLVAQPKRDRLRRSA